MNGHGMKNRCLTGDKVLVSLAIVLSLVVLLMLFFHYPAYLPDKKGTVRTSAISVVPEQVRLDYLYADWCSYCAVTQPAVTSVAMRFGPAVSLNQYNEALRASDPGVAALYADYKARKMFNIFPTLIAHGAKGESALAGMQNEEQIQKWLCTQYEHPPALCASLK